MGRDGGGVGWERRASGTAKIVAVHHHLEDGLGIPTSQARPQPALCRYVAFSAMYARQTRKRRRRPFRGSHSRPSPSEDVIISLTSKASRRPPFKVSLRIGEDLL